MCSVSKCTLYRPWLSPDPVTPRVQQKFDDNESVSSSSSEFQRQSVSSLSAQSLDDMMAIGSIGLLSNLVFNTNPNQSQSSTTDDVRSGFSSSSSDSSRASPTPVQSAFAPINQSASMHPQFSADICNEMNQLRLGYYQTLLQGFQIPPSLAPYSGVEYAVSMVQQQDVAAKQLKKLRVKKYKCKYCGAAFSNKGQTKGHERIHTGERPFTCDFEKCGRKFTRNEELTRHKRIHTGDRPHGCIVCGKKFGRKDHLRKHTRTHENRGPYQMTPMDPFAFGHHHVMTPVQSIAPYYYPM